VTRPEFDDIYDLINVGVIDDSSVSFPVYGQATRESMISYLWIIKHLEHKPTFEEFYFAVIVDQEFEHSIEALEYLKDR